MNNANYITKGEDMSALSILMGSPITRRSGLGLAQRIHKFAALSKERAELAKLSDAQLKDIGITPDQAQKEAARPAWDIPEGRTSAC